MRPWYVMRISGDIISARKDVQYITSTPLGHNNYGKEVLSTPERSHGEYWGTPGTVANVHYKGVSIYYRWFYQTASPTFIMISPFIFSISLQFTDDIEYPSVYGQHGCAATPWCTEHTLLSF